MRQLSENARALPSVSWDAVMDRVEERYKELASLERMQLSRKRGVFRKEMEKVDLSLEKRRWT
jgi:hypothetical protein